MMLETRGNVGDLRPVFFVALGTHGDGMVISEHVATSSPLSKALFIEIFSSEGDIFVICNGARCSFLLDVFFDPMEKDRW